MDLNHDYLGQEPFLVAGARERLQMCKCAILAFGDLGYTDPPLPDLREFLGEYTDVPTGEALEARIREILEVGQLCTPEEILSIAVTSPVGADYFTVSLQLSFGSEVFNAPAIL